MPLKLSVTTSNLRKARHALFSLHADQRGTVAVIMAFMFPILIGAFGLGFEITNWYLTTRSMQNAADAAAIAAATNGSANYNTEAAAVATQYGYTNGSNDVTLAASNAATCPADPSLTPPCYSVTITRVLPLVLTEVVGYLGNSTLNGGRAQNLTSTAVANKPTIQTPICLLGLDTQRHGYSHQWRSQYRLHRLHRNVELQRPLAMALTSKPRWASLTARTMAAA